MSVISLAMCCTCTGASDILTLTLPLSQVLGQRGPAGGQRSALAGTRQSAGSVFLEAVLPHRSVHVCGGTEPPLTSTSAGSDAYKHRLVLTALNFFIRKSSRSSSPCCLGRSSGSSRATTPPAQRRPTRPTCMRPASRCQPLPSLCFIISTSTTSSGLG